MKASLSDIEANRQIQIAINIYPLFVEYVEIDIVPRTKVTRFVNEILK